MRNNLTRYWTAIILFSGCLTIAACAKKQYEVRYSFPNWMRPITDEEFSLITGKEYVVTEFRKNSSLKRSSNSIFTFDKSGVIRNASDTIGTWSRDRNVFLDRYDKKFFISRITPGCNGITLETRYTQGDTIRKTIRIQLVDREYLKKVKLDKINKIEAEPRDDEFQF